MPACKMLEHSEIDFQRLNETKKGNFLQAPDFAITESRH